MKFEGMVQYGRDFMTQKSRILIVMIMICLILNPVGVWAEVNETDTLTILFTHDIQDHMDPFKTDVSGTVTEWGGIARIAGMVSREKEMDPELLLVDAGDYSMGTLFQMIYRDESPMLRLMGMIGYDAVTLGNHEYDFLPQGLKQSLNRAVDAGGRLPAIVASNTIFPANAEGELLELQDAMDRYGVHEYFVVEKKGIRIGLFGLMGKEADSNAPMAGVVFADQMETARQMVKVLRDEEKVDLIVCLSHSGTSGDGPRSEDIALAKTVSGIDVIISGHSHTLLTEPYRVGDTWIGSSGQYGSHVGRIVMSKVDGKWSLADYHVIPITAEIPEDPLIKNEVRLFAAMVENRYLDAFWFKSDTVLINSSFSFTSYDQLGVRHEEEPLGNLISDAYRYAVRLAEGDRYEPIAVTVVPAGTIRGSLVKGGITVADAFIVSSLGTGPDGKSGFPLLSVYLTGNELKAVCEVDASITPLMSSAQLYMSGIRYTFNPYRLIFNKVTDVVLVNEDGIEEKIQPDRLYRVVVGLYSAQMLSVVGEKSFGLLSITPKLSNGEPITDYLEQIIYQTTGDGLEELKEWVALAEYLSVLSNEAENQGIIPLRYASMEGRKIISQDPSLWGRLHAPNRFAMMVYSVLLAVLFLLFMGSRRIRKAWVARRNQ
jgi:2',3'-cyclic-nucleotide 2'-phosphodiesterase (5'-nucleotidase family)